MATSATEEQVEVTLRLVVDEEKNKVVFAHAGKDFVDALLSFLTLPLGTIARLVAEVSNIEFEKVSIGSLSSMHESVANMEVKHFLTETCKEMLLLPRNSMEIYCQNMKLNIDNTEKMKYFICDYWGCSRKASGGLFSTFRNTRCKCGNLMNREISHSGINGFIPEMGSFIIFDDLKVMPNNFHGSSVLLGIGDFNAMKEVTVNVTKSVMVDLLKYSFLSKTPLTDLFLRKKLLSANYQLSTLNFNIGEPGADVAEEMMKIKVMLRKSNCEILFALAEADFVDFLFSFLTFPMGGVEHMLKGNSGLSSIDNLYKSMVDLDDYKYLKSPELKDKLVKSQIAHQFKLQKQILPIDEVPLPLPDCSCFSYINNHNYTGFLTVLQGFSTGCKGYDQAVYAPLSYLEPQSLTGDAYSSLGGRGFVKSPTLYLVTDDLVVTPYSPISAISLLTELRISPSDLEERVISIGQKEGLHLLRASLISYMSLSTALGQFIEPIKVEKCN